MNGSLIVTYAVVLAALFTAATTGRDPQNRGPRPIRVLFLCTGNSARSQMAEGLLRHLGGERYEVFSAGTHPKDRIHPLAVEAMRRRGIDITGQYPKHVSALEAQGFDLFVSVCDSAAQECPILAGAAKRLHWSEPDPAAAPGTDEEKLAVFEAVRDDLESRICTLVTGVELGRGE